jgi:hypothetical protein
MIKIAIGRFIDDITQSAIVETISARDSNGLVTLTTEILH